MSSSAGYRVDGDRRQAWRIAAFGKMTYETTMERDFDSKLAIVPAYNEEEAIGATVAAIRRWAPDFDVVVIDDGSADATAQRARATGAAVLELPFNLGIGGAMQSGYIYALEHGYDVAVQVDGDGQHDPRHMRDLLERLGGEDDLNMVTGSRFLDSAGEGYRSSALRRVGIRLFSRVVSLITGRRVTDPTSGFRMTDRRGIELFARDYPHDYPEVEAILLMHAHRLRSCEVPVRMRPRATGTSAISSTQSVYYMVKVLLAVFVGLFRSRPAARPGGVEEPAPDHERRAPGNARPVAPAAASDASALEAARSAPIAGAGAQASTNPGPGAEDATEGSPLAVEGAP
jgi:hypothetical protein